MKIRDKEIVYSRKFSKQLKLSPLVIRAEFADKFALFLEDSHHPQLKLHSLNGKLKGYQSLNITGDWRALFVETPQQVTFEALGTHSELYR